MSSRRFEIEKKKLAVRRLSQQSAKRNLHSPQGNERFSFKSNLSAEELKLKRKKLQQRLGTLEGNPAKKPPNQNQPLRPGINRTWVKKDEPEQKKENPFVWRGGDLRKKLATKDDGYQAPGVEESSGDKNIKEIKQFVTPPSFGHAQTSSPALPQTDAVFNPFAVALKSSESKTSDPEILKPSPQTKQGSFPTDNVLTQNLFGLPIANMNKRDDFGDGKQETLPAKTNIFTGKADTLQSNPFALALRTKDANLPQIQKPISYPESHPNKSSIGFSGSDNSNAEPNIGLINPFASTAQVPKLGSVVNKQDQNSGSNSWKPVMGSGPFSGIQAGKQPELGSSLISNNLSIKLMQIPDELNDKEFLRSFFLRFGRISRVYHHVNTKSAIITFLDHIIAEAELVRNSASLQFMARSCVCNIKNIDLDNLKHLDTCEDPMQRNPEVLSTSADVAMIEEDEERYSAEDDDMEVLNKRTKLEDPYPITEFLQLTLVEAFFLKFGLGCLTVLDDNEEPLSTTELWNRFRKLKQRFVETYAVYHYFRSKGWVVRDGIVYGSDFLLYKDGMPFYHSSYAVFSYMVVNSEIGITKDSLPWTWQYLTCINRVAEHVAKEVLMCLVVKPNDFNETELNSQRCLSKFEVQELLLRRWVPEKHREAKKDKKSS